MLPSFQGFLTLHNYEVIKYVKSASILKVTDISCSSEVFF